MQTALRDEHIRLDKATMTNKPKFINYEGHDSSDSMVWMGISRLVVLACIYGGRGVGGGYPDVLLELNGMRST